MKFWHTALHKYIRQESISLKVYKIDLNSANSYYKRWEDTLTQSSGAEKFVVFFSVVLTLINYTRSAGLVSKNAKSVLILDNPFGKITGKGVIQKDIIPLLLQIGLVPSLCIAVPFILEMIFGISILVKRAKKLF